MDGKEDYKIMKIEVFDFSAKVKELMKKLPPLGNQDDKTNEKINKKDSGKTAD